MVFLILDQFPGKRPFWSSSGSLQFYVISNITNTIMSYQWSHNDHISNTTESCKYRGHWKFQFRIKFNVIMVAISLWYLKIFLMENCSLILININIFAYNIYPFKKLLLSKRLQALDYFIFMTNHKKNWYPIQISMLGLTILSNFTRSQNSMV